MIKTAINKQKGVSLILTIFVMVILLAVVLFLSLILYTEVVNVKNISDAVTAFSAADSGVEKVLFYDRQVLPSWQDSNENTVTASRGLCSMFDVTNNPGQYCHEGTGSSLNCNTGHVLDATQPGEVRDYLTNHNLDPNDYLDGCNPEVCNACQFYFDTDFDKRNYHTIAEVLPSADGKSVNFDIKSAGYFNRSARQVEVYITSQYSSEAITIINACVTPISAGSGQDIYISAEVYANFQGDTVGSVTATIKNLATDTTGIPVPLSLDPVYGDSATGNGVWTGTWETSVVGSYFADITVVDNQGGTSGGSVTKTQTNILPYPECLSE